MSLCDDNEKISFLGPGYPLFFLFIKYCIAILFFYLLIPGLYGIYTNYTGTYCTINTDKCYQNYATLLSLTNKINDYDTLDVQQWLNLILVITMAVFLHIMRWHVRKTYAKCDEEDISAADFTVMVGGIPVLEGINYQDELKQLIENVDYQENSKFEVTNVTLTYNLSDYYK